MMRFCIATLVVALITVFSVCDAQVRGKVVDSVTQLPLPYAHLFDDVEENGTVTNDEGFFELGGGSADANIYVSHVGYRSKTFPARRLAADSVIRLAPHVIVLDEVLVDDSGVRIARELLHKFVDDARTLSGRAFYRQVTLNAGRPVEVMEGFYNVAFTAAGIDKFSPYEARYGRLPPDDQTPPFYYKNLSYLVFGFTMFAPVSRSLIRPLTKDYIDHFHFTSAGQYTDAGQRYQIFEYTPPEEEAARAVSGSFIVNMSRKMIVAFTAETESSLGIDSVLSVGAAGNGGTVKIGNFSHRWHLRFSDRGDVPVLETIEVDASLDMLFNGKTAPVRAAALLVIYETDRRRRKGLKEPDGATRDIEALARTGYRPQFWRDNPVVLRTSFENEAIKLLEDHDAFRRR